MEQIQKPKQFSINELVNECYAIAASKGFHSPIIIRTCDLMAFLGIDADKFLNEKMEKNRNRPMKHGKRF